MCVGCLTDRNDAAALPGYEPMRRFEERFEAGAFAWLLDRARAWVDRCCFVLGARIRS